MKIYLDIDGVILKKDYSLPDYAKEFISFLTTNYYGYWLTTHCRGGSNNSVSYLSEYYPASTIVQLQTIKSTDWTDLKTEAIDLNSDFIWLEDYPLESEKEILRKANRTDSLITVDLNRENELKSVQNKIELVINQTDRNESKAI